MNAPAEGVGARSAQRLGRTFCLAVLSLAFYQFSENTADPDLWAHTMFGEQSLLTGTIQRTEVYSWTAHGLPFVNHEVLAEAIIGGSHLIAGGPGILLLKMFMGFLAFGIALRTGSTQLNWPKRAVAWAVGAIAVVEISYGFPARPQIFTAASLATELWLIRRIHEGKLKSAIFLPVLFAVWINAHGGALAGLAVMLVAACTTAAQFSWNRYAGPRASMLNPLPVSAKSIVCLWLTWPVCSLALLVNPWGIELVRWIAVAVVWPRPEIEEWNPAHLGWDHAAFFILVALAIVSFAASRRPRAYWEIAVTAVLAWQAFGTVRHTPLFCLAALSFVPPHLADVFERWKDHFARLVEAFSRPVVQKLACIGLVVVSVAMLAGTFVLHKDHPVTMEVPKSQYPVAAIEFIRQHDLRGNMLTFFDWGEMCLWELPDCSVSMDGRMDACYPHDLILEHWKLYNDQPVDRKILNIEQADLALLPQNLAGAHALSKMPGWSTVYFDDLAVVLVRDATRFAGLNHGIFPVQGDANAARGRAPFPSSLPPRVQRIKAH